MFKISPTPKFVTPGLDPGVHVFLRTHPLPSPLPRWGGERLEPPGKAEPFLRIQKVGRSPAAVRVQIAVTLLLKREWVIPMSKHEAKFQIGQIIHHKLFDYVGVVFDADPTFQGTDEWYEQVARSRPPKDQPWYHVLVHEAELTTYVAEQNLEPAHAPQKIMHPLADKLFGGFDGERYYPAQQSH